VVVKEGGVLEVQDAAEPEPGSDQIKVKIAFAGFAAAILKLLPATICPYRPWVLSVGLNHPHPWRPNRGSGS